MESGNEASSPLYQIRSVKILISHARYREPKRRRTHAQFTVRKIKFRRDRIPYGISGHLRDRLIHRSNEREKRTDFLREIHGEVKTPMVKVASQRNAAFGRVRIRSRTLPNVYCISLAGDASCICYHGNLTVSSTVCYQVYQI